MISVVIPVKDEPDVAVVIEDVLGSVEESVEVLVIYDDPGDTSLTSLLPAADLDPRITPILNSFGSGVLNALRTGFDRAQGDVICVTMGDGSDEVHQIPQMASLIRQGSAVAAASRYMPGGSQLGAPRVKSLVSRWGGKSLRLLTGLGTHDPTSNFKAYSADFLAITPIRSRLGFEVALELTVRAHLAGLEVSEIPTTWQERSKGASKFHLLKWLPGYLRWYLWCLAGTWLGFRRKSRDRIRRSGVL